MKKRPLEPSKTFFRFVKAKPDGLLVFRAGRGVLRKAPGAGQEALRKAPGAGQEALQKAPGCRAQGGKCSEVPKISFRSVQPELHRQHFEPVVQKGMVIEKERERIFLKEPTVAKITVILKESRIQILDFTV